MLFNPQKSDLVGVAPATLQQWLTDVQQAIHDLTIGTKPIIVTYTQGDGTRSVTYTRANLADLHAYAAELKAQLGITRGRSPLRPVF